MDESDVHGPGKQRRCRWCDCEESPPRWGEMIPGLGEIDVIRMGIYVGVENPPRWLEFGSTCLCGCGIHPFVGILADGIPIEDLLQKPQFSELEKILGRKFWIEDQGDESESER